MAVGCGSTAKPSAGESKPPKPLKTTAKVEKTPPSTPVLPKFERPTNVRGIYLTAWSAGSKKKMAKMMALLDRTELNSVVIDIRDDGEMYFPTKIPLADQTVGKKFIAVTNAPALMKTLLAHKVWPIARIACYRDHYLPLKDPSRSVQTANGKPWRDHSGHMWLDPYDKRNWQYIADTVDYAMNIGFPEIQLDYVRFPSEGKSSTQVFPNKKKYDDPKAHPDDVIEAFAKWIGERVRKRGCSYSADVFGIISSGTVDQGIGQTLEKVALPFDTLSPMVYPSHFAKGEYKIADPNRSPYAIIKKSLTDYKRRLPKMPIRPWLQDFSLGYPYGAKEVRAQIKAAEELGYPEFLLWNASNRYTEGALLKEKAVASSQVASQPEKPSTPPDLRK
jgi:hypothetical protein